MKVLKHLALPIRDWQYDDIVDVGGKHILLICYWIDSAAIIDVVQRIEEENSIRVIDTESHATWGRENIPDQYSLTVICGNAEYSAQITQLFSMRKDSKPEFTLTLHPVKANV